jgi:hypothetical protein
MTVGSTAQARKLAAQLTWLANRDILNPPEDRRRGSCRATRSRC